MKGIGQRIRRAREARGLSQEQLAKSVGIAQQTLAKLESDPARGTKHILAFARALGQDPEWIETGKGQFDAGGSMGPVPVMITEFEPVTVIGAVQAGVWRDHARPWVFRQEPLFERDAIVEPYQARLGLQALAADALCPTAVTQRDRRRLRAERIDQLRADRKHNNEQNDRRTPAHVDPVV
jgi:transcriptional regulator with XRE-family HTH domain